MSHRELIDALHREAEAAMANIWQSAEEEAGRIRDDAARQCERLRAEHQRRQQEAFDREGEALLHEGRLQAQRIRLMAEKESSDRCYHIARECLKGLRDDGYPELFQQLVRELPCCPWGVVRVNPLDIQLAHSFFPDATVVADPAISGGLSVMTDDEKIEVRNTFETRLDRAWAGFVPELLKKIRTMVS